MTIADVVMRLPTLGAQNQSLPPAALIFCIWTAGKVLSAGTNTLPCASSTPARSFSHGLIRWLLSSIRQSGCSDFTRARISWYGIWRWPIFQPHPSKISSGILP